MKRPEYVKPRTIQDDVCDFAEKNKKLLWRTYEEPESNEKYNSNIEKCFYNSKELQEVLSDQDNQLEKTWRTRVLYQNTPYGNVVMSYDPYKRGFSYYSDQTMNYSILNSLAMRYVTTYRCRDFFMDEKSIPENTELVFLKIQKEEEKEKKKDNTEKKHRMGFKEEDAPFAKFKNYDKQRVIDKEKEKEKNLNKDKKETDKKEQTNPEKIYENNRFIYLGKMVNFKLLQLIPVKKVKKTPEIKLHNNTNININIDIEDKTKLSWKDFKSLSNSI